MSGHTDLTIPSTRRPRKSTGHSPVRKRMEKENITVDLASSLAGNGSRKKSRSKSMGPGGLDVLKSGSGNRRVSLAAPSRPPPRSILKPTIPQLPEIPPHKSKAASRISPPQGTVQGLDKMPNPFQNDDSSSSGTKIALRTEEEQQAAAREREEKERAQLEKEIKDRRDARRKSLANRRVSFAAEATLHTFHDIEYMQDSTTSTDSTRRGSSLAAQPSASAEASDPPSTPPEKTDDVVPGSPEDQRNLHQKNRRSSGMSALGYNHNQDDLTLASSVYSSDSEATEGVTEIHEEIGSDSGSDSDADGVTMDLVDEMTGTSVASAMSSRSAFTDAGFTDGGDDTLDDALRLATRRAETQRVDDEEEIIPSFGWVKKPGQKPAALAHEPESPPNLTQNDDETTAPMDMEITRAVGGIITSRDNDLQEEEISMDVTRAFGGIIPSRAQATIEQPGTGNRFGENSVEDATMEFTTAIGGIRNALRPDDSTMQDENEDLSMELTTVMGAVVSATKSNAAKRRVSLARRRTLAKDDETNMDMTVGLGRIITADEEDEGDEVDVTMGMDMTTAVGRIIQEPSPAKSQAEARQIMEQEVDVPDGADTSEPPQASPFKTNVAKDTLEAESPGLLPFRGKGLRRSTNRRASETPKGKSPKRNGPISKPTSLGAWDSPSTPQLSSPLKTPNSLLSQTRSSSPIRLAPNSANTTPRSTTRRGFKSSIFQQNPTTGITTPQIVLTPQKRQLSGVGADRSGLGSPKVTAILDRRESIGDTADPFMPRENFRAVSFTEPQILENELDWERQQEQAKENDFSVLGGGAEGDEENGTTTLKDMISSMTPKKNPLKGRKSLHVGSASGLLGKRPAELDEEEDDDYDRDGVKRLKNHQSSPVKNVRLRAPPSKEETTGRTLRSTDRTLEFGNGSIAAPLAPSPNKGINSVPTPQSSRRPKDIPSDQPTSTFTLHDLAPLSSAEGASDMDGDHIHLQDFLNMTSIRFMELTTTKRRHTQAPNTQKDVLRGQEDLSLERCIVAGACTVPMLELYQHSCRELKKYISEGRRIVREIETETFEENPPLFKEYITATPEFKALMDNQFKNVKTHARLLSKAMWYEWRMKLQDGLKEGLEKIWEGMAADEKLLQKQQALLNSTLPDLVQQSELLTTEHENLEAVAQELAACDPEDLDSARTELTSVDSDIEAKKRKIEELRTQLAETESSIGTATERKQSCIADIEAAEKEREECRGWTSNEINSLKAKVDNLERRYGWAISGLAGTTISMTYEREIELAFDVSSLRGGSSTSHSQIDLSYIAANRNCDALPPSPEKEFFVRCIRDHVRGMAQARTGIPAVLRAVSRAWKQANHVAANVRLLNCTFPTNVIRQSDSSIAVRSTLLLAALETKVEIMLALHPENNPDGLQVAITPQARVVYGEHFKIDNVVDYLATRIGGSVVTKEEGPETGSWSDVIVELHERLLARGRK